MRTHWILKNVGQASWFVRTGQQACPRCDRQGADPLLRAALCLVMAAASMAAEVRVLTLREAVDTALKQNPDMLLARLDERKAEDAVRVARDAFVPKVMVGSGLAYSSGFPLSIEGSAPAAFRADAVASIINRPQSYRVAQAREMARGATIDTAARREEAVYRTATLYLEAARLGQAAGLARRQIAMLEQIAEAAGARVSDGRELPIEGKRAALRLAQGRQRAMELEAARDDAEIALAAVLGFPAEDRVRPSDQERTVGGATEPLEELIQMALDSNKEIRKLESSVLAQSLEVKANKAAWLPRVDLVAQYAMLTRYNNYEDFFSKFQRNNGQLGVSFQLPLLSGSAAAANASRAEAEVSRLRIRINELRNRVSADTRKAHQDVAAANSALEVARLDLDVAREQVTLLLAQLQEGRATLRQVEEARFAETGKWIALYDAQFAAERARLHLLKQTGNLMAALK